ncbi:Uncharacterized protein TCM_031391 [Theobroma cacao]|uniref:Uncharacterized protein n=1 Tax=Theobroma cacao TaxID=3641 RepID=A0A061FEG9_THECC|nr:Uncharacterized protein TCM_031391 [Theobroma cacao]
MRKLELKLSERKKGTLLNICFMKQQRMVYSIPHLILTSSTVRCCKFVHVLHLLSCLSFYVK